MTDLLHEPGFVTEHQVPIVLADRNIYVTACPGSGKTRTASVRVARLAHDGFRVAACSYTNVGVEQIQQVLADDLKVSLGPQHFVGTLHRLLLRFVFYPHGRLVTGGTGPLRLISDDGGWPPIALGDNATRLGPSYFRFRPDGTLCVRSTPSNFRLSAERAVQLGQEQALDRKRRFARNRGWVSFDDAMYVSLRVLQRHPDIAGAVAGRFNEILVDEAQDTSELQLACLRELVATGRLGSLTLIGDLEQSISSYTGANPHGCATLAAASGLTEMPLTENHRSSQLICNAAAHFCGRPEPDKAVGEDAGWPWSPEILYYRADDPPSAIRAFRARMIALGHDPTDALVLARANNLVDELNGKSAPVTVDERVLAIGRVVYAMRTGLPVGRHAMAKIDRALARSAFDVNDVSELEEGQPWQIRAAAMQLLQAAPSLELDTREWTAALRVQFTAAVKAVVPEPAIPAHRLFRSRVGQEKYAAADVFSSAPQTIAAQTIHDVKGESSGAVLIVIDRHRWTRKTAQCDLWSRPLLGLAAGDEEEAEELRIAFVAMTRARRLCIIALPDSAAQEVKDAFAKAGFSAVGPGEIGEVRQA